MDAAVSGISPLSSVLNISERWPASVVGSCPVVTAVQKRCFRWHDAPTSKTSAQAGSTVANGGIGGSTLSDEWNGDDHELSILNAG